MKYIFWIALVAAVVGMAGQIALAEYTSTLFQDDLHEITAQPGTHIGLAPVTSTNEELREELRGKIVHAADGHGIRLDPKELAVRTSGPMGHRNMSIAVDYTMPVNLLVGSFNLHFSATSSGVTY
ncbi:MAG TPA: hypothetical protein VKR59_16010 [Terriglobales bacterium]|nr:hypothetical protein [Terriglobales bacterium]